jgi:polyisoprenoid-binding protein YceI
MRVIWTVVLAAAAAGGMSLVAVAEPTAAKSSFKVDPVHSAVLFKILHMGASNVWGRFNAFSGSMALDEANPSASSLDFEVKADSIDTNNEKRDQHLKGPDFFNAKQFPAISYKGKGVKKSGEAYEASGDLTLHGVTRPLTLKVEKVGTGKGPTGGTVTGFETTFVIKRSDFGLGATFKPPMLGDEITITASVECSGP